MHIARATETKNFQRNCICFTLHSLFYKIFYRALLCVCNVHLYTNTFSIAIEWINLVVIYWTKQKQVNDKFKNGFSWMSNSNMNNMLRQYISQWFFREKWLNDFHWKIHIRQCSVDIMICQWSNTSILIEINFNKDREQSGRDT